MSLKRFSQSIDGTIPIQALLYDDEELLGSQDNVGIYDGQQKSPRHQSGTAYITSHRLFYVDGPKPDSCSFSIDLSHVSRTDYYAGLFTSSPKVTLYLAGDVSSESNDEHAPSIWECQVCGNHNSPGFSPSAARICGLCGVPRDAADDSTEGSSAPHLSSSLPASGFAGPVQRSSKDPVPCPACTFLNHPSLRTCELCETDLPRRPSRRELQSAPVSRPHSPDNDEEGDPANMLIKVSFRKGGDKAIYGALKTSLNGKVWESKAATVDRGGGNRSVGISGILRTVENSVQERETSMHDALQDLEALMVKAKDMVNLAAELNYKLTAASSTNDEPEEATFIRSSLTQLGLHIDNAPVTQDMTKDERRWHEELARELAKVLQAGLMRDKGIVALDEVWGGWNRARGVALIPPATFLQVIPLLPQYTTPQVSTRKFVSGLTVLHTPPYSASAFSARLAGFLVMHGSRTTLEIALEMELDMEGSNEAGMSVSLCKEMVEDCEREGGVCRDDVGQCAIVGGGGVGVEVRWWPNLFVGYVWDGQSEEDD
ncbi:EAP30/Vps36 family-domain-containing protein [Ephemerocybe angulata]|uniref:Vacuolar protein-sorting-associated protein 36 n=1 Tax=Ephemerocybe angulata TaxID=980116 RepID=A0A8H6M670_9AGAR|nr:EAP30/Vps36 family-domain-containing protein [Tulosesus angulatus]KAF6756275.1 EAP30/Vps36 family-domain-containing protein [Tulosesus angulatus]